MRVYYDRYALLFMLRFIFHDIETRYYAVMSSCAQARAARQAAARLLYV